MALPYLIADAIPPGASKPAAHLPHKLSDTFSQSQQDAEILFNTMLCRLGWTLWGQRSSGILSVQHLR